MNKQNLISLLSSCVFGYLCIALSIFVSIEVVLRKVFSTSLQGADELGGYVLAITSSIAFCVALIGNSHIRIDILHYRFPNLIQALLNWLASVSTVILSLILAVTSWRVLRETLEYGSTAPTPWATPLKYPQTLWVLGIGLFCVLAIVYCIGSTRLLFKRRWDDLRILFQPKGSASEVREELEDITNR